MINDIYRMYDCLEDYKEQEALKFFLNKYNLKEHDLW